MFNIGFDFSRLFAKPFVRFFIRFVSAELVCVFMIAVMLTFFVALGCSWSFTCQIVRPFRSAAFSV